MHETSRLFVHFRKQLLSYYIRRQLLVKAPPDRSDYSVFKSSNLILIITRVMIIRITDTGSAIHGVCTKPATI